MVPASLDPADWSLHPRLPPTEDHQQRICELETTLLGLEQSLNKLEHRNETLQHQLTSTSAAAEEHNRSVDDRRNDGI